jgi:hypothetical protein
MFQSHPGVHKLTFPLTDHKMLDSVWATRIHDRLISLVLVDQCLGLHGSPDLPTNCSKQESQYRTVFLGFGQHDYGTWHRFDTILDRNSAAERVLLW